VLPTDFAKDGRSHLCEQAASSIASRPERSAVEQEAEPAGHPGHRAGFLAEANVDGEQRAAEAPKNSLLTIADRLAKSWTTKQHRCRVQPLGRLDLAEREALMTAQP